MNIEEKAKAYDEALEKARKIHNEILNNEIIGFPEQIREIFPQLLENEHKIKSAIDLIAEERERQISKGFNWKHDDEHDCHQLSDAAIVYAAPAPLRYQVMNWWPWDKKWLKEDGSFTTEGRIRELVKAGALIVAEIERLQRTVNNVTKPNESEDERMTRVIGLALTDVPEERFTSLGTTLKDCFSYLEKQKDLDKMIVVSPDVWDNAITDAYENGKKDGEKQKERPDVPDRKTILKIWEIGNEWKEGDQEGLTQLAYIQKHWSEYMDEQKEQTPAYEQFPPLEGLDAIKAKYYDDGFKNGFDEGVESVKPAEWDDYTKTNLDRALQIIRDAKGTLQGYQSDDGIYECDKAIECIEHFLYRGLEIEKPAEWSEDDKKMLLSIINAFRNGTVSTIGQEQWLKSLPKKFDPQPKQEWSEEDEKFFQLLHAGLYAMKVKIGKDEYDKAVERLKSLRSQPKQEWDTHDKAIVNCIVCCLDGQFVSESARKQSLEWFNKHRRDFLNNHSWKPSEEQMRAFKGYIEDCQARAEAAVGGWNNFYVMIRLYEQLKKL